MKINFKNNCKKNIIELSFNLVAILLFLKYVAGYIAGPIDCSLLTGSSIDHFQIWIHIQNRRKFLIYNNTTKFLWLGNNKNCFNYEHNIMLK